LWQRVGRHTQLQTNCTLLDGDVRDVLVRGTTYVEDWDLQAQASYYQMLKTQRAQANEFDPFYDAAFDYFPYVQFRSHVSKGFGDCLTVESGLDLRRVRHDSDESQFNREYERVYVSPSLENVFVEGLSIDLTGEYWGSDGGEDVLTYGADLSYKVNERIRASLGTYYALYKHDLTSSRERERVRTYYLGVERRCGPLRLRLDYEFEDAELDNYHELVARMTWTF
jgi:hypothetical protein